MNWGKAIVLTFILFAGFIGVMIYRMCRQSVDLVRDDYYQTEIVYQQQIDRIANARQNKPISMTFQADSQQFTIVLPMALRKGELHFYRPANRELDFNVPIPIAHTSRQVVSTAKLARGYWRVQFTWSDGEHDYYNEDDLFL